MKTSLSQSRPFAILAAALLAAVSLPSCKSVSDARYAATNDGSPASAGRSMKRDASQTVRVSNLNKAGTAVEPMVMNLGGYLDSYSMEGDEERAYFSIRVPASKLTPALDSFAGLGREINRSLSGQDVTDEIADDRATLPELKAHRQRLLALLKTTTKVEDRLKIEAKITELNAEIAQHEGNLKKLQHAVAMSKIALRLEQQQIPGPGRLLFGGLGKLFGWFFGS